MSRRKITKEIAKEKIKKFFLDLSDKDTEDIRKIKNLAMTYNVQLKENKKLFCKKCLIPFRNSKIRVNKNYKNVTCENCGFISRWKIHK